MRDGVPVRELGLAASVLVVQAVLAVAVPSGDGRTPDLLGWTLLVGTALVLVARRRAPGLSAAAVICLLVPYHAMNFAHSAAVPATLVALYSLALAGPPMRTFMTVAASLAAMTTVMVALGNSDLVSDMLRSAGWLFAVVLVGEAVRIHRNYVTAIMERAERAERTREEEAARRVAEERLRIARDLHDLLAHSITLIGVQTSVAAHVLVADPQRLDRAAVADALEGISGTCRDARAELRTTLEVLRANDPDGHDPNGHGPLPGLAGLPDLVRSAEGAGARVESAVGVEPDAALPRAVSVAVYRIVQEALTNAVRHAGASVGARVTVEYSADGDALRVEVRDDGGMEVPDPAVHPATGPDPATTGRPAGYGIVGMRERARSVGGTLDAGPRADAPGFAVTAVLPLEPARGELLKETR
ncbi:MAG: sensor histidine kinase [Streptomyces sp.]|uniref:sensor histidine kinase n=1 Tax=Streptomyces sp. TaxID=1931 RepID=UPI003D6B532A